MFPASHKIPRPIPNHARSPRIIQSVEKLHLNLRLIIILRELVNLSCDKHCEEFVRIIFMISASNAKQIFVHRLLVTL
jgi:hypothetical protein